MVWPSKSMVRFLGSRVSAGGGFGKVISLPGNQLSESPRGSGESCASMCARVRAVETAVTVGKRQIRVERPKKPSAWPWVM